MKNARFYFIALLTVFFASGIAENANAQRRGRTRTRVTVVSRTRHPIVVRRAQMHYAGMPRWGASVSVVPAGAVMLRGRRNQYYFHNGIYYAPRNNAYVVVRPARGLRVTVLPVGFRTIVLGPRNYYYYYGTYYQQNSNAGYTVVDPPVGAVVDSLPDGYEVANVSGTEYYTLDGVTYAEVDAPEFEDGVGYQVVSL